MAFIPVPEVAHCRLIFSDDGQEAINDLYFAFGATPTPTDLQLLAADVSSWWASFMAPLVCDVVTLREVTAADLGNVAGAVGTHLPAGDIGTVGSEQAPNNVAPCISFRTGFRGRSFRGRNYIVGVPNAEIAVNTLSATWMSDVTAAYTRFIDKTAGITNPAWDWVVVSRFTAGGPRTTGIFTFVTSCGFTDNIVDSQRRRLPGRGR